MRKFSAMMIIGMLASATLANSALCAPPPYQYGWWGKDPQGRWQWRGGWGASGHWVRHGHQWVYRWR